ncbi:ammonium transporter [Paenirhodobacter populi]|uniref:Ammonium transporter n=1 Tax=Paenirhodobacter populi TaxID=2306993 RepID=A0A443K3Z5_9RHOB|nr:ammonium transporter [Sinirhodobacter populi]RWR06687.1 ammonium transporter [Sinirhodobacter populi]RWR18333.1 ammonium transporter [Sinirhodobacter populi]RWR27497.1 ammonium transporter [Sinirhodobacter populi]
MKKLSMITGLASAFALAALPALAQDAEVVEAVVDTIDSGDTAWMLMSTALVAFMIFPGIALFYSGLVRAKSALSLIVQTALIACTVMVIWVVYGYSFAFGPSEGMFFGGFGKVFLSGVTADSLSGTIPEYLFIAFQMTFAALTPALIIGGFVERVKLSGAVLFCALWVTFVYFPIAHMAWGGGLFGTWGVMDFAGGTVVHINAGIAALVGAYVIGPRIGLGKDLMAPHSLPLTFIGTSILFVGWFGFNAGSAAAADGSASLAMLNTFTATAGATLAWCLVETLTRGKASALGACSGVIAGLVAVTPAAGFVGPVGAIFLGAIGSIISFFFVAVVKNKFGYDDSLDVFGIHGVAGFVGAILTGVFAAPSLGGVGFEEGVTMGAQVWVQIKSVAVTIVWGVVVSFILYKITDVIVGLRVSADDERQGLDQTSHGESAYHL